MGLKAALGGLLNQEHDLLVQLDASTKVFESFACFYCTTRKCLQRVYKTVTLFCLNRL
jgi:hypothetical protein